MMIPDKQYWKLYAYMPDHVVCEAVQLTQPTLINGEPFESGDYSVRFFDQSKWIGVKKWKFEDPKQYLPTAPWREDHRYERADPCEALAEKVDTLIVAVARLTLTMKRYGIANDPAQK